MLEEGRTGFLVELRDPQGLADALGPILADPAIRREAGDAARAHVKSSYSLTRTAATLDRLYRGHSRSMSILCYHAVDPRWGSTLSLTPAEFERQCAWLARRRSVIPLQDAVAALDGSFRLPRGCVSITFDDGF